MCDYLTGPRRTPSGATRAHRRFAYCMALAAALFLFSFGHAFAQRGVTVSFLQDAAASLGVEDAASPAKANDYQVYVPSFMAFSRIPGDFNGALWLRIGLGASFEKPLGALRVNLGSDLPGMTTLYIPGTGGFTAMRNAPREGVFTLPETTPLPDALYVRFDGVPGLWFRPVLEAAPEDDSRVPPHVPLCGVFGAAMLLLLVQYIRKGEEWRVWAAITAGGGIAAALVPPLPPAGAAFAPLMTAAMLIPGLLLVFFAHAARHLFDSPRTMRGYDALLAACYAIGGLIALWPLIPGSLWVSRYLPLANAAMLLLLPVGMAAVARALGGGANFLCATLLSVAGTAVAAWELTSSDAPFLGGLGGLFGLALGLLVLGFARPLRATDGKSAEDDVFASLDTALPAPAPADPSFLSSPAGTPEEISLPPATLPDEPASVTLVDEEAFPAEVDGEAPPAEVDGEALPAASGVDLPAQAFVFPPPGFAVRGVESRIFDLQLLIKEAYHAAAALGEEKNIGMSWFIAPQTGRLFEGQADLLDSALRLLLRDMVGAVDRGNVRLTVRRLPDSKDAGHLVFTVVEWDARETYYARNMAGLAEAWALAEKTGGVFNVEHSPSSGTTVIFSSVFTPMDKAGTALSANGALSPQAPPAPVFFDDVGDAAPSIPPGLDAAALSAGTETGRACARIIIADTAASSRTRTAAMFKKSPYSVLECASPPSAGALYARHPCALVLMNADMPEVDIAAAIRDIHAEDSLHGRSPVPVAAIVRHKAQADRMVRAGCARTVTHPLKRGILLALAGELAPLPDAGTPDAAPKNQEPPQAQTALPDTPPQTKEEPEARTAAQDAALREAATNQPVPSPETMLHGAFDDLPPVAAPREAEEKPVPEHVLPENSGIVASVLRDGGPEDAPVAPEKTDAHSGGPKLALLDMIITDEEDAPEAREREAAPQPEPERKRNVPVVRAAAKTGAPVVNKPRLSVSGVKVEPRQAKPGAATLSARSPAKPVLHSPAAFIEEHAMERENLPMSFPASGAFPTSIPLPGEDDSVFRDMLPLVPGLICELDDAMLDAARGREEKSPLLVQQAAERMAGKAEHFGLVKFERMARCVERAAAADDIEPMECVLADLEAWVARYKEALNKLHRDHPW